MAKRRKLRPGDCYFFEWLDAYTPGNSGWHSEEEMEEVGSEPFTVWTVGWLQRETKEYFIVASTVAIQSKQKASIFAIPKAWVRRVEEITYG